jgi:hypothetical protein
MTKDEEVEFQEVRFISAEDEAKSNDSVLVTKMTAAGDVTGLWTGRSIDDRHAGVDLTEDGRIAAQTAGPTPAKDDRELRTGQGLVNYFNAQGAHWGPTELAPGGKHEQGVDCIAVDTETDTVKLLIQVTMVDRTDTWKQLRQTQIATHPDTTVETIVETIKTAIESKRHHPKKGIHLALDATDSISSALPPVTDTFRAAYGPWAATLGYEGIYLVGPETLVARLDVPGGPSMASGVR